jgi:hypothetical protein
VTLYHDDGTVCDDDDCELSPHYERRRAVSDKCPFPLCTEKATERLGGRLYCPACAAWLRSGVA